MKVVITIAKTSLSGWDTAFELITSIY